MRVYVRNRLGKKRGRRAELASAIGSQNAFVSQVLGELGHFNLEHGEKLNRFLGHSAEEAHYFLLLIQLARSGTPGLRRYFEGQLDQVVECRMKIKNRFKASPELSPEDQQIFFSSWVYAAVVACVGVPALEKRDAIARRLGLAAQRVTEVLEFLTLRGLVIAVGEHHRPGKTWIHLGADSPLVSKHHVNWRTRGLHSLENPPLREDLHYSSVVSISSETALKIRALILDALTEARKAVEASPSEDVHVLNLDFFRL